MTILFISRKTPLETCANLSLNLTSVWLSAIIIIPSFFKNHSPTEYFQTLIDNVPFVIVGLVTTLFLAEKAKEI